jgi:hypothetical protein
MPGGLVSTRTVSFENDVDRLDFLDRICAYMDMTPSTAQLGYKWNFERRRDLPHRLHTTQDAAEAISETIHLSTVKRRENVILEIVDLVGTLQ